MRWRNVVVPFLMALFAVGCGYSEEEWQAQLDKYNRLQSANQSTEAKLAQVNKDLDAEKRHVAELTDQLKAAGVDISKLNENLQQKEGQVSKLSTTLEDREK